MSYSFLLLIIILLLCIPIDCLAQASVMVQPSNNLSNHPVVSYSMPELTMVALQCLIILINVLFSLFAYRFWQNQKYFWKRALQKNNDAKPEERKTILPEEKLKYFRDELTRIMDDEHVYLDPELTLTKLTESLGIQSPVYLSQVINHYYSQHFNDYVNAYRIDFAKGLLDEEVIGKTILDIAFESGFNSKSAFYRAFKKHTGMNPLEYQTSKYVHQ